MIFVALLRGVNVAGSGNLPMAKLKALVESLGYTRVETFIASGNVILEGLGTSAAVGAKIEVALAKKIGLTTSVIVRTAGELAAVANGHAFADRGAEPSRLHVIFLAEAPRAAVAAKLDPNRSPPDELALRGREIHLHTPNGIGRSKITIDWVERTLGTRATARNLNTVTKLAALSARR